MSYNQLLGRHFLKISTFIFKSPKALKKVTLVGEPWENSIYSFPKMELEVASLHLSSSAHTALVFLTQHLKWTHFPLQFGRCINCDIWLLQIKERTCPLMCCLCCLFLIYCILDFRSSICIFLANSVWRLCLSTCLELYVHKIRANFKWQSSEKETKDTSSLFNAKCSPLSVAEVSEYKMASFKKYYFWSCSLTVLFFLHLDWKQWLTS